MSVELLYKGKPVRMYPGIEISWEGENDLLDIGSIGSGQSWPLKLPKKGNEWIFHHAGDEDTADDLLQVYDGFDLLLDGINVYHVSFDLTDADAVSYEGNLTTINSRLQEYQSTSIRDILKDRLSMDLSAWDGTVVGLNGTNALYNSDPNSPFVFPYIHFYNQVEPISQLLVINSDLGSLLPCFKAVYILRLCLDEIGVEYYDEYSSYGDFVKKLILVNNRIYGSAGIDSLGAYQFLPDISLYDLIRDVCSLSASKPEINPENINQLTIRSLGRDLEKKVVAGMKDQLVYKGKTKPGFDGIRFLFENLSRDSVISDSMDEPALVYDGEFANLYDYNSSSPATGHYAYVKSEGAYYGKVSQFGSNALKRISEPFANRNEDLEDALEVTVKSLPASKQRYAYIEVDLNETLSNSPLGKVRIPWAIPSILKYGPYTASDIQVSWRQENGYDAYGVNGGFAQVTTLSDTLIDLDVTYSVDVPVSQLIIRIILDYHVPVIGEGFHYPEWDFNNENFTPRILIYHGMVTGADGSTSYPYASADPYDYQGVKVSDVSLQWRGVDSIYEQKWKRVIDFVSSTVVITYDATAASIESLKQLMRLRIGRSVKSKFLFKRIRAVFGERGLKSQEVEGWKV